MLPKYKNKVKAATNKEKYRYAKNFSGDKVQLRDFYILPSFPHVQSTLFHLVYIYTGLIFTFQNQVV